MSSDRAAFQGFQNLRANYLRATPEILRLDLDDILKYTLLVIQYETHGRAYRTRTPQNCFGFYPITGKVLARRLGLGTEGHAIKKLIELQEMGFIELRRQAPNAPYEVRLRWIGTSEAHPKFKGFSPKYNFSIEVPNEVFTIEDNNFGAVFRLTLISTHAHLLDQAHSCAQEPYGFQEVVLPEIRQYLQAAERTLRYRLEKLVELGYLHSQTLEGSRQLTYRMAWKGLGSGNGVGGNGNQVGGVGNELGGDCNQVGGVGNELGGVGNEFGVEPGNELGGVVQPGVQRILGSSYKLSLTQSPLAPQPESEGSESEPTVGGGLQPAAGTASLLTDPAVLVCLELLEGAGVVLSALQLRKVEGTRSKTEVLQALKGSIAALNQGQKITADTVLAALKGQEKPRIQTLAPETTQTLPKRLLEAIAVQGANRRKFGTMVASELQGGVIASALASLAKRPDRSPWGLSGFGLPSEKRPLDAPPLRMMIHNADPNPESLPIEVASSVEDAYKVLSCAIQEVPCERKTWSQAVEDLCSATVYGLNYLLATDRPDTARLLTRIHDQAIQFMNTWLLPGGKKSELLKSLDNDLRKGLQESLDAAGKRLGLVVVA